MNFRHSSQYCKVSLKLFTKKYPFFCKFLCVYIVYINSLDNDFSNFLKCSVTGKTHIKIYYSRIKVPFSILPVQSLLYHVFLWLSTAVEKITIRYIVLSIIRTTEPTSIVSSPYICLRPVSDVELFMCRT